MKTYQSNVAIARPPEDVWPYLVERDKQALWSDVPMRPITEGPLATGSRFEISFGKGPISATLGIELTGVEVNRRMAWKSFSGPIDWEGEYLLQPADGDGATLSQHGTLVFHGMWRLLEPFVGAEIKSAEIKELEKLKAAAEGSAKAST
jgi:hypothetical protein